MKYPIEIGCTITRHHQIGIDAIINARGKEQWRNDLTLDEIELRRDGRAIRSHLTDRIRFYQVNSKFYQRHFKQISHMIASYDD